MEPLVPGDIPPRTLAALLAPSPRALELAALPAPRDDAQAAAHVAAALTALREHGAADVTVAQQALLLLERAFGASRASLALAARSGALQAVLSVLRAHDDIVANWTACALACELLEAHKSLCAHSALLEVAAAAAAALHVAARDAAPKLASAASMLVARAFYPAQYDAESVARRAHAVQQELPQLLTDALASHLDNTYAACALGSVVNSSPAGQAAAARVGALCALTAALRAHAGAADVTVIVLEALCACFAGCSDESRQPGVAEATVSALVDVLRRHPAHRKLQALGCAAVGNIAAADKSARAAAGAAGAVEAVAAALNRFDGDEKLQAYGVGALSKLTIYYKPNGERAVAAGALPHVLRALPRCSARGRACVTAVYRPAVCACAFLCVTHEACVAALAAGAVTEICALMRAHASDTPTLAYGCSALENMAGTVRLNDMDGLAATAARRAAAGAQGGVPAALAVLRHADYMPKHAAVSALMALCHGDARNARAALADGAVPAVVALLNAYPCDEEMNCVTLSTLLVMHDAAPAAAAAPFAATAEAVAASTARAVVAHPDQEVVLQAGPSLLASMASASPAACAAVVRTRVLEACVAALRRRVLESNGPTWTALWSCVCVLAVKDAHAAGLAPILRMERAKRDPDMESALGAMEQALDAAPPDDAADAAATCTTPGCGATERADGSGRQLQLCAGSCGAARYCSVACQRIDWMRHKAECKPARRGPRGADDKE